MAHTRSLRFTLLVSLAPSRAGGHGSPTARGDFARGNPRAAMDMLAARAGARCAIVAPPAPRTGA